MNVSLLNNLVIPKLLLATLSIAVLAGCTGEQSSELTTTASCDGNVTPFQQLSEGQNVAVSGVVKGIFHGEQQLGGFFIQGEDGAAFVADAGELASIAEGQELQVTGTVSSYYGGWQLSDVSDIANCGNSEVQTASITLPLADNESLDDLIHHRVQLSQDMLVIGHYQLARFGTLDIATERLYTPTQVVQPGADAAVRSAYNNARRLVLDDGSWAENPAHIPYPTGGLRMDNPVRSGDTIRNIEGILVRVGNSYHIHPVIEPEFIATNPRPAVPEMPEGGVRVVAFNVLNYFNGDGQGGGFPTPRGAESPEEFARQRAKTISTMLALDADIYGLMEMENDGFDNNSALADLTRGLNAAVSGSPFAYVAADAPRIGSDAITQAIIYRSDRVSTAGPASWTTEGAFSWGSRPPLLQNFRINGSNKEIAIVANHFKSKGGCPRERDDVNANQNDGQACWNLLRTEAAAELVNWLASNPKDLNHTNYVVMGDFNAYRMEEPLAILATAGYPNVATRFDKDGASYVFRGEMGSLDHMLVHESIWDAVTGMAHWHINADEPIAFEYPLSGKTEWQQEHFYAPEPYRSSDHDPIIMVIDAAQLH
ncbi:MAG: ExeM/NucH family extracellular endonuclease [Idiomarina sp.]|nr:ExeM/NucH family extracellular endonuclease [Idiomarina sp.]